MCAVSPAPAVSQLRDVAEAIDQLLSHQYVWKRVMWFADAFRSPPRGPPRVVSLPPTGTYLESDTLLAIRSFDVGSAVKVVTEAGVPSLRCYLFRKDNLPEEMGKWMGGTFGTWLDARGSLKVRVDVGLGGEGQTTMEMCVGNCSAYLQGGWHLSRHLVATGMTGTRRRCRSVGSRRS